MNRRIWIVTTLPDKRKLRRSKIHNMLSGAGSLVVDRLERIVADCSYPPPPPPSRARRSAKQSSKRFQFAKFNAIIFEVMMFVFQITRINRLNAIQRDDEEHKCTFKPKLFWRQTIAAGQPRYDNVTLRTHGGSCKRGCN